MGYISCECCYPKDFRMDGNESWSRQSGFKYLSRDNVVLFEKNVTPTDNAVPAIPTLFTV